MPVYQIDPLHDPRWGELVDRHPAASVFHSPAWLGSLRETYGYDPMVFTSCAPGRQLTDGIAFCAIRSWITGSRLVSLPFSDHCEPLFEEPQQPAEVLNEIGSKVSRGKWDYVEIRPLHSGIAARLEGTDFGKAKTFNFHMLDLSPSIEDLFRAFDKSSAQRKIRRAEREGLLYEEGRSEGLLAEFYRLQLLTRRRHHVPPQSMRWFCNLAHRLGENFKVRIARVGSQPIASIITLRHNGTMVYKYGGSDLRFGSLGGTALLFWHMIQDAKRTGCHLLDLGRSDDDNAGLIRFKDNWGARDSTLMYWRYPAPAGKTSPSSQTTAVARNLISRLPDRVFVALGELVYRHIG